MTDPVLVIVSGIVGLAVGSFLNVAIVRLPAGKSVVAPPSHCPRCGERLRWVHNIPLVSWIALRGRCAFCAARIGAQYPFVEAATAMIWAANAAFLGPTAEAARAIVLLSLLLAIAVTDLRHYIIPDELSLGGTVAGVLLALPPGAPSLPESVVGSIVGGGLLWGVAIVGSRVLGREAMGGGDIKLMAMIGAFLGWKGALLTIFLGALSGTLIFGPIALYARLSRRPETLVPFGVFLAIGAGLTLYLGEPLLRWYLGPG
ncbi:MAG TPA: prepilin peptidase [Gemmatimonadota bacterium]|nr:prepilin peptidase [Gemmatimonadota bacterium]